MTATIEDLQEQVVHLKGMLAELRGGIDQHTQLRHAFGLSPKQAQALALLLNTTRPLSLETVYANVYEHPNGGGPDFPIVKVAMSQLRLKMGDRGAPSGGIAAAYGTGCYSLTPELRAWIQQRLAPMQVAA